MQKENPRTLFRLGADAYSRSFPEDAAKELRAFYVCPECLEAVFDPAKLSQGHAPPESVGGTKVALVCRTCESRAGSNLDIHLKRELDVFGFAEGNLPEIKSALQAPSGKVPVRLSATESGIEAHVVKRAVHLDTYQEVVADFERAAEEQKWDGFDMKFNFEAYSRNRAKVSLLRSAYLLFFATCGYKFVCRPELDPVRRKFESPESSELDPFSIILKQPMKEPRLVVIEEPTAFRSYAMLYRRYAVFLPRYGDHDLYKRLAQRPEAQQPNGSVEVEFKGGRYPWPSGTPTFFDDFS
jgi:hypothetical protein